MSTPAQLVDDALHAQQDYSNELECGWNKDNCRPALEAACDATRQALIDAFTPSPAPVQPEITPPLVQWAKEQEVKRAQLGKLAKRMAVQYEPVVAKAHAWMRRWAFDGETPAKARNENGRLAWPDKFKLLPVTVLQCSRDDVPLYAGAAPVAPADKLDAEMFRWFMSGDRTSTGMLLGLHMRLVSGNRPTLDEWRAAIDAAMNASKA